MKNIPRIFIDATLSENKPVLISRETSHYLSRVMRTNACLVFNNGYEYDAELSDDKKSLLVGEKTSHLDPSNNITLYFSPIRKMDDMLNMATQMGVEKIVPVITARTTHKNINWPRMQKIMIEAAEQSNRNSVPEMAPAQNFADINWGGVAFADERAAYGREMNIASNNINAVLVGPEGGFSDDEFAALDASGAVGISLGKTILRAELAAAIAIGRLLK